MKRTWRATTEEASVLRWAELGASDGEESKGQRSWRTERGSRQEKKPKDVGLICNLHLCYAVEFMAGIKM